MTPEFFMWFAIALAGWFAISLLLGWFIGLFIRATTGEPETPELELLDVDDVDWDWPERRAA